MNGCNDSSPSDILESHSSCTSISFELDFVTVQPGW